MSTYDSYETVEVPRRHRSHSHSTHTHRHRERRDRDRDDYDEPRYVETKETYVSRAPPAIVPEAPYSPTYNAPYGARTTELIRRPMREDSDLSVQEITRDFPPPAGGPIAYVQQHRSVVRDDRYGPVRSRSAERDSQYGAYLGDPRRSDRDVRGSDRRSRQIAVAHEETIQPRRRSLSRNQKILAAVGGAALAVGGKELFDRRGDLKHAPANRNMLATAAVGAAGAFAAYEGTEIAYKRFGGKEEVKKKKYTAVADENGNVAEYYSSGTDDEKRPKPSRRKSIVEGAMALAGLGAAKAAISGHGKDRSRGGDYSDDSYDGRRSTRSRRGSSHNDGAAKFQQAAKAALLAGATEAFRVRNEPGGWGGAKGKRILTAAIGASAIDAAADRNPDSKSKRHILEAVIGGLAGNRLVNGSRKEIDEDDDGRSIKGGRSRSRARSKSRGPGGAGGLAALATAGLGALAAKKMVDRSRSRSRGGDRDRRRDRSSSSDAPRDKRRRSKSVTDFARKGLAAIGLGEAVHHETRDRSRSRDDRRRGDTVVEDTYVSHKGGSRRDRDRGIDDDYEGGGGRSRGGVYGNPDYNDSRGSNISDLHQETRSGRRR